MTTRHTDSHSNGRSTSLERKSTDEIREDIARTKRELHQEVDSLTSRFTKERIMEAAKDSVKELKNEAVEALKHKAENTVGNAKDAAVHAIGVVKDKAGDVADGIRDAAASAAETVKEHTDNFKIKAEGAVEDLKDVTHRAAHAAKSSAIDLGEKAKVMGQHIARYSNQNRVPLLLIGAGVTILVLQARRKRNLLSAPIEELATRVDTGQSQNGSGLASLRGKAESVIHTAQDKMHAAQEKFGEVREAVAEKGSELRQTGAQYGRRVAEASRSGARKVKEAYDDNPILLALGVMAVGLGLGFLLPISRREQRLIGPPRQALTETLEEKWESAKEAASSTAREVTRIAQDEAHVQGLV